MRPKIKKLNEIESIINRERNLGKIIGLTNGVFDILHLGHIRYLEKAKNDVDALVVALNSDSSVKEIKGNRRPINNELARAEVLAALESVN
jgi:D-beta-D-heptose 7-phosphate kinase/D-beta-D-heptose 1-phosphate adenosyltransferase